MSNVKRLPDKGDTYVCACCKTVHVSRTPRSECIAEWEILNDAEFSDEGKQVVCHECWTKFREWQKREGKL